MSSSCTALAGALVFAAAPARARAAPPECAFGELHFVWIDSYYFENNGGFCPPTRDCTGALYPQSDYHTYRFLWTGHYAVVHVETGTILWEGPDTEWPTIDDTKFSFCIKGTPIIGVVVYDHPSGAFSLVDAAGVSLYEVSEPVLADESSNTTFIDLNVGSPAQPDPDANIYAAADRTWDKLDDSGVLGMYMRGARIFPSAGDATLTDFPANNIVIGRPSWFTGSVMHEMGHFAEQVAALHALDPQAIKPGAVDYCFDGACNHSFTTPEYKHTAYVEALADFVKAASLYQQNARQPYICESEGACGAAFDLEPSSLPCPLLADRFEGNVARALWDLYDSVGDVGFSESVSYAFTIVFTTTIRSFPAGGGNHQINEPWTSDLSLIDDLDGRSIEDHALYFSALTGGENLDEIGRHACLWSWSWQPWWTKLVSVLRWF